MPIHVAAAVTDIRRIGGGDDGMNAGELLCFAGVDADDFGMGVLTTQDGAVQLVLEHQIDAVDALTDDALDAAHSGWTCTDDFEFSFCHDDGLLSGLRNFPAKAHYKIQNPNIEIRNKKEAQAESQKS